MSSPRILVLGAGGMLGHKMFQVLSRRFLDTWGALRGSRTEAPFHRIELFQSRRMIENLDVADLRAVEMLLRMLHPDVIVNCTGVIKQRTEAQQAIPSITINSLLPHHLASASASWGGRLIHFSTDCVFSGRRGGYTEDDPADAEDLYGRSKLLGEVSGRNALTLRTSMIGRELKHHASLLEWFLAQDGGSVRGFTQTWWSGVTTNHLADLVADIISDHPELSGLYQVSSARISKFTLLELLKDGYDLDVRVEPDGTFVCDRSLSGDRLQSAIGYQCPPWSVLIEQLVRDPTPYEEWTRAE